MQSKAAEEVNDLVTRSEIGDLSKEEDTHLEHVCMYQLLFASQRQV